jgi:hypothetical protein
VDIAPVGSAGLDKRLIVMLGIGFRFGTNCDSAGLVVALVGARIHHGVIDIVQLFGAHDADATRVSCDEPNILLPRAVFWRTTGSATHVIDALLGLADPALQRKHNGHSAQVR